MVIGGMIETMESITRHQKKDIRLIGKFVEVYCAAKHPAAVNLPFALPGGLKDRMLCQECAAFLAYAVNKRIKCPLESEKPSCKHCRIHCYDKSQREVIRKVMAYSGRKLILRGRLDYIWHYYF